jgi:small subunit ribosomal protein S10
MTEQKIRVRLRGYDIELVDKAAKSIVSAVKKSGAKFSGPIPLPSKKSRVTVLRSVNINVKSREQFEMRTHKRLIDIEPVEGTLESMMKLELAAGVDVDIKQY